MSWFRVKAFAAGSFWAKAVVFCVCVGVGLLQRHILLIIALPARDLASQSLGCSSVLVAVVVCSYPQRWGHITEPQAFLVQWPCSLSMVATSFGTAMYMG